MPPQTGNSNEKYGNSPRLPFAGAGAERCCWLGDLDGLGLSGTCALTFGFEPEKEAASSPSKAQWAILSKLRQQSCQSCSAHSSAPSKCFAPISSTSTKAPKLTKANTVDFFTLFLPVAVLPDWFCAFEGVFPAKLDLLVLTDEFSA